MSRSLAFIGLFILGLSAVAATVATTDDEVKRMREEARQLRREADEIVEAGQTAADRKLALSAIVQGPVAPMGVYSKKHKSLQGIQNGAKVALPNDPSNLARALVLLEQHTMAEAARLCGRPPKTVEAQVYRAKKMLAETIRQERRSEDGIVS